LLISSHPVNVSESATRLPLVAPAPCLTTRTQRHARARSPKCAIAELVTNAAYGDDEFRVRFIALEPHA
jgi:hypothetical protein